LTETFKLIEVNIFFAQEVRWGNGKVKVKSCCLVQFDLPFAGLRKPPQRCMKMQQYP